MNWNESVEVAEEWRRKGEVGWELNVRSSAIVGLLGEAVRMDQELGLSMLREPRVGEQLARITEIGRTQGQWGDSRDIGDVAILTGAAKDALSLIENAACNPVRLWAEYDRARTALLKGESYCVPTNLRLKGWLSTFLGHLRLAEVLSCGGDVGKAMKEADAGFRRRNNEAAMYDPGNVDGDGRAPVRWDVRKASVLAAARLGHNVHAN